MMGVTRGISTLAGRRSQASCCGSPRRSAPRRRSEYWATYGLIAAAGLTMALSQILGGWTKWGWPRFSLGVFTLGFLPVLVAGGWMLLARQPADWMNTSNWSRDLGIFGAVADLGNVLPAIGFGIGLVFGLSFDTAGPEREVTREVMPAEHVRAAPVPEAETRDATGRRRAADRGSRRVRRPPTVPGGPERGHRRRTGPTATTPAGERRIGDLIKGSVA